MSQSRRTFLLTHWHVRDGECRVQPQLLTQDRSSSHAAAETDLLGIMVTACIDSATAPSKRSRAVDDPTLREANCELKKHSPLRQHLLRWRFLFSRKDDLHRGVQCEQDPACAPVTPGLLRTWCHGCGG